MPFKIRKSGKGKGRGNNSQSSHFKSGESGNYGGRPPKKKDAALERTATEGLVDRLIIMREINSKDGIKKMTAMQMMDELLVAALPKASLSELIKAKKYLYESGATDEYNRRVLEGDHRGCNCQDPWTEEDHAKFATLEGLFTKKEPNPADNDGSLQQSSLPSVQDLRSGFTSESTGP